MEERRQHVRVNAPVLIEFAHPESGQKERSFTQDVSESGLRFPTPAKFPIGHTLTIMLTLPYHTAPCRATGEVIWIREIARLGATQYEIGLRFQWIEYPDREQLARSLQAFASSQV